MSCDASKAGASRRQFARGIAIGAFALALRPSLLLAQESGDEQLAAFAESVELAAVEAYADATGALTATAVDLASVFADHHREHSAAFAGIAGDAATGDPNGELLDEISSQLDDSVDEREVLQVLFDLENALAATHLFALGALVSTETLRLTASTLPVEAEHAVALGTLFGKPLPELAPSFENADRALRPDRFPVE